MERKSLMFSQTKLFVDLRREQTGGIGNKRLSDVGGDCVCLGKSQERETWCCQGNHTDQE